MDKNKNSNKSFYSTLSIIFGISSILPFIGIITGALAALSGVAALIDISKHNRTGRIEAIIGITLGICFCLMWLFLKKELDSIIS